MVKVMWNKENNGVLLTIDVVKTEYQLKNKDNGK
jgi:hypothetical protein